MKEILGREEQMLTRWQREWLMKLLHRKNYNMGEALDTLDKIKDDFDEVT